MDGWYKGDDGGRYFARRIGDELWWVGIGPDDAWVNVFHGTVHGDSIEGGWADVPRGFNSGDGSLTLQVRKFGSAFVGFVITAASGGFAGKKLDFVAKDDQAFPPPAETFAPKYGDRLTGGWLGDDGGRYYIRQVGSTIWWFGEDPNARWHHVFHGSVEDALVTGTWADIPAGILQSGALSVRVDDVGPIPPQVLTRASETGGFGATRWVRRGDEQTALAIRFTELLCHEDTDGMGDDEVYAVIFSARLSGLPPSVATFRTEIFPNMSQDEKETPNLLIWGPRREKSIAQPAPITRHSKLGSDMLILVGLIEEDGENPKTVETAVANACLGTLIASLSADDDRATLVKNVANAFEGAADLGLVSGMKHFDPGELIDVDELRLSRATLEDARRSATTSELNLDGRGARYTATFRIGPRF